MIMIITPALTKMFAAMATETLSWCVVQTNRIVQVVIRAIQKPKRAPDARNLWPFLRFSCRIVIWATAPMMNSTRKTDVMGASTLVLGSPPTAAIVEAQGGPEGCEDYDSPLVSCSKDLQVEKMAMMPPCETAIVYKRIKSTRIVLPPQESRESIPLTDGRTCDSLEARIHTHRHTILSLEGQSFRSRLFQPGLARFGISSSTLTPCLFENQGLMLHKMECSVDSLVVMTSLLLRDDQ